MDSPLGVGRVVPHSRLPHFQPAGAGEQLARGDVPIADHQAAALVVATIGVLGQELLHLVFNGGLKHLLSPLADNLIQRTSRLELGPKPHDLGVGGFMATPRLGVPWTFWFLCRSLMHGVSSCPRRAAEVVGNISRIRHLFLPYQHTRFDNSSHDKPVLLFPGIWFPLTRNQ